MMAVVDVNAFHASCWHAERHNCFIQDGQNIISG